MNYSNENDIEKYSDYSLLYLALMNQSYNSAAIVLDGMSIEDINFNESHGNNLTLMDLIFNHNYNNKYIKNAHRNLIQKLIEKGLDIQKKYQEKSIIERIDDLYYTDNNTHEHLYYVEMLINKNNIHIFSKKKYEVQVIDPNKNQHYSSRNTYLIHKSFSHDYLNDVGEKMIELGYNPNIQDEYGCSPLFYTQNSQTIDKLLKYKIDPNIKDNNGYDFFDYQKEDKSEYCPNKLYNIITILEEQDIRLNLNVDLGKEYFWTEIALINNKFITQKKLKNIFNEFSQKYDINYKKIKNKEEENLLFYFIKNNNYVGMFEMSKVTKQWNMPNKQGITPLMYTAAHFHNIGFTYYLTDKAKTKQKEKCLDNMIERNISDKDIEIFNNEFNQNFSKYDFISNQITIDFIDIEMKNIKDNLYEKQNILYSHNINNIFTLNSIENKEYYSNFPTQIKLDNLTIKKFNDLMNLHRKNYDDYHNHKNYNIFTRHISHILIDFYLEIEKYILANSNNELSKEIIQNSIFIISEMENEQIDKKNKSTHSYLATEHAKSLKKLSIKYNINEQEHIKPSTLLNLKNEPNQFLINLKSLPTIQKKTYI